MTETTYGRYMAALKAIADGHPDPVAVAVEALRSRVPAPKPKIVRRRAEEIKQASQERARIMYDRWVAAGKPSKYKFAKSLGMNGNTGRYWITRGEWLERRRRFREKSAP